MEKTVESVSEMNVKANEKLELDKITEAGKNLTPILAQGYLGLNNLGNSCYINSVLQVGAWHRYGNRHCPKQSAPRTNSCYTSTSCCNQHGNRHCPGQETPKKRGPTGGGPKEILPHN
eukprot:scaffold34947_cov101-Isochrysis_galbana.AAC.2